MEEYRNLYNRYCLKCKWCYSCIDDDNSGCTEEDFKKCFELDSEHIEELESIKRCLI